MAEIKKEDKKNTKSSPVDSEIVFVIFLMLLIVVVPLAIAIWDIGEPIPGFAGFSLPPQIS